MSNKTHSVDPSAVLTDIYVKVSSTCVINLTRPSSNPDKPIQRQYLILQGEQFKITAAPSSPVTIGVIPFESMPETLKLKED